MSFFLRLPIGLLFTLVGVLFLVKSYKIVHFIGYNAWAEEHLGGGGTYTLVKIFGLFLIGASAIFISDVLGIF